MIKCFDDFESFYDKEGCCLTCIRHNKKQGCLCNDMKCTLCFYYVPKKYSPNYGKGHCGYGEINAVKLNG